jgi:hypothetical protein
VEFHRTPGVITLTDGTRIHGVGIINEKTKKPEVLVHVAVDANGHGSAVDYTAHPNFNYKVQHPPGVAAEKATRFLEGGGEKFLGHSLSPQSRAVEVAKLKAIHGLS